MHYSLKYSMTFVKRDWGMCSSRKYPGLFPHKKRLEFPGEGGGGFRKTKKVKEMYETKLEFPDWWRGLRVNPFCGEVWIFSGTTQ